MGTRFAIALNVLLDDLAFRVAERQKMEEAAAAVAEDGGHRPAGRRHGARLQQPAVGDPWATPRLLVAQLGASDPPRRSRLEEIRTAGERAPDLTQQLLAFSRRQVLAPSARPQRDGLRGLKRMLRRLIGEDVELTLPCAQPRRSRPGRPQAGRAGADEPRRQRARRDAAAAAASRSRSSRRRARRELRAQHPDVAAGHYVMLAVTDTGHGMDRATLRRDLRAVLHDQGASSKGTGLGLSTVLRHRPADRRAHLGLQRAGRRHDLQGLPPAVATSRTSRGGRRPRPRGELGARRGDHPPGRGRRTRCASSSRTILRRHGYHVLEAQNAGEALPRLRAVPGDDPPPAHRRRHAPHERADSSPSGCAPLRPEMKHLYISGYTDARSSTTACSTPASRSCRSHHARSLLRKVREVLDSGH